MRKNTKRYGAVLGVVIGAVAIERVPLHRILGCAVEVDGRDGDRLAASTNNNRTADSKLAGFAGFETSDAILAIAENAQQQVDWNTTQARNAVRAVKTNHHDALHYIDDFVDGTTARDQRGVRGEGHRAGREAARASR